MSFFLRITTYAVVLGLVIGLSPGFVGGGSPETFRIGVLMDLTGPEDLEPEKVLDWAAEMVNSTGGIAGHQVEMVYRDTHEVDSAKAGREFLSDDSIKVVIGPLTSADAFKLAPLFINKKKLLISPTATSADLFRAFAGKKFFWRTAPGDVDQTMVILRLLKEKGAQRLSLVYQDSAYGKTFLEWLPFFAQEMGLEVSDVVPYEPGEQGVARTVDKALAGTPDYVVAAAFSAEAASLKKEWDTRDTPARLFLTDAAQTADLIKQLGAAAEGLEGTSPTFAPASGFEQAYLQKFGGPPLSYAATIWDSFLLAAYTLARNEYKAGAEWMEDSLRAVVSGRGAAVNWNEAGRGLELIARGGRPNMGGAAGPLEFDDKYGVDPVRSYYAHWVVENSGFRTERVLSTVESGDGSPGSRASASRSRANDRFRSFSLLAPGGDNTPGERSGLWAVIVSSTKGWGNYRHQSDALALYDMLRGNGVLDSRIILFLVDDIPLDKKNPQPGVVRHEPGGRNNRAGAQIDYTGEKVTSGNLVGVLTGEKTTDTTAVLESNSSTDVLIYLVGHGLEGAVQYDYGPRLTAGDLAAAIAAMGEKGMFRQMLVMTELCFGASMGQGIDTPGVLYFTASNAKEQSFGANYDAEVGAWLADDFTHQALTVLERNPTGYLTDLYSEVYRRVSGSHTQMLNYENFANVRGARVSDFFGP